MKGAEYIAQFLVDRGIDKVFLMTGGACAFMVDAIARHPKIDYWCFLQEQAAAMAADSLWRLTGKPGVAMATSGPGATNLLTGIACSYFDSIPTIHITGQVNIRESAAYMGAQVRQAGFQETNIVDMARPVTKYAVQVRTIEELKRELVKAYNIAMTGRRGPVLIDVPMNLQQEEAGDVVEYDPALGAEADAAADHSALIAELSEFLRGGERPLVMFGAGVGLSGSAGPTAAWLARHDMPFVASWNALTFFDHNLPSYCGQTGVYGNRGANYVLQNCDRLLVLGSRLDNRQRSGNPKNFAPGARVHVIDIDGEELKKYAPDGYGTTQMDLRHLPEVLAGLTPPPLNASWRDYIAGMKDTWFGRDISTFGPSQGTLSPYWVVQQVNRMIAEDAVVVADCGANLCWVYQVFHRSRHDLFTAGGCSPMGYSVPAAIGAALAAPDRQIVCFIGDGGLQVNIQELQTIRHYGLNISIIVLNNYGFGIIKQFQDSYMEGRHEASGRGYSLPDLGQVAAAYGLGYHRVDKPEDLRPELFRHDRATLIDVTLDERTLIEPKLEMGRPINDQFPYVGDADFQAANRFVPFKRP